MKRRDFFAGLMGASVAPASAASPKIEMARSAVQPICPRCGLFVLFVEPTYDKGATDLVRVECHPECGWKGYSMKSHVASV